MQKLIVSFMRLSSAMTLFGMEQLQTAAGTMNGDTDMSKAIDKLREAIDNVTDRLVEEVDESKRETLATITRISADTVDRTWRGMNMGLLDPNEALRATSDLLKKTSGSVADWVSKADANAEEVADPQPVAEALS